MVCENSIILKAIGPKRGAANGGRKKYITLIF
jgi:hypothetical protein